MCVGGGGGGVVYVTGLGSFLYFSALSVRSALQWSLSNLDTLKEVS